MDISAITAQFVTFLQTGLGQLLGQVARFLYEIFSPSNAPAAHDVPLPTPRVPQV